MCKQYKRIKDFSSSPLYLDITTIFITNSTCFNLDRSVFFRYLYHISSVIRQCFFSFLRNDKIPITAKFHRTDLATCSHSTEGWLGVAKVLGKLSVPGHSAFWITVGQGPIALAVGVGGGCLDIFSHINLFFFLSPSLWETARYRPKYCLKGPLNPKEPTNQM